ncbi:MAG: NUDIX hydrolase [Actinomycetes bacterium]
MIRAAGTVLWRPGPSGAAEVHLVHRPRYDDWSFPKGKLGAREHVLIGAVREVQEETGIRPLLGRPLPDQQYLADGVPKFVRYWAATPVTESGFTPTPEVDQARWVPIEDAARLLTWPRDQELLAAFLTDPVPTVAVVVLRHAHARPRRKWMGPDCQRPLTVRGVQQAHRLASILGTYRPREIIASDTRRTQDTVAELAVLTDVAVGTEPCFGEPAGPPGAAALVAAGRTLASAPAGPVLVCTHRPSLPYLLAGLIGRDEPVTTGDLPVDPTLPPGGWLVAHLAAAAETPARGIVAWERFAS